MSRGGTGTGIRTLGSAPSLTSWVARNTSLKSAELSSPHVPMAGRVASSVHHGPSDLLAASQTCRGAFALAVAPAWNTPALRGSLPSC